MINLNNFDVEIAGCDDKKRAGRCLVGVIVRRAGNTCLRRRKGIKGVFGISWNIGHAASRHVFGDDGKPYEGDAGRGRRHQSNVNEK